MALTILTPSGKQRPSKTFFRNDNGKIGQKAYPNVKHFICETRSVNGLDDLYRELIQIEHDQQALVIRGGLIQDVDLFEPVRRRLKRKAQQTSPNEYPFIDIPEHWLCIDIDSLSIPDDADYDSMSREAIDYAVSLLPEEFHNVSLISQFSSSNGIFNNSSIKLHVWFWLKDSIDTYSLKEWGRAINLLKGFKLIDTNLYNPVQPHYIVPPMFLDDIEDPIKERTLLITKDKTEVEYDFSEAISEANDLAPGTQPGSQFQDSFASSVHGYKNILELLGDHESGEGFNSVLVRATGSLVATEGEQWVQGHRENILQDLRDRIDRADHSGHSDDYIESKKSDVYLNSMIDGAIDKGFGEGKDHEPPYFDKTPLSIEEGEVKLRDAVRRFQGRIKNAKEHIDQRLKNNIAIKAAAGLGKTTEIIQKLIAYRIRHIDQKKSPIYIEYYVPTHNLSDQVAEDVRREFKKKAKIIRMTTNEETEIEVNVILGLENTLEDGSPVCKKQDLARVLKRLRKPIEPLLCQNNVGQCEFYDNCYYQNQFKVTQDNTNELNLPVVNILAHNHLFYKKREGLPDPEFIVIDESFYQAGISKVDVNLDDFRRTRTDISRVIYDALIDKKPLLKALRENNITPTELEAEAARHIPGFQGISNLSPEMGLARQQELLKDDFAHSKFDLLLYTLADELRTVDRDESHTVSYSNNEGYVWQRMEMNIPESTPVLFIDADLNKKIINLFRPDTEFFNIPVEREATVHQFNRTWSAHSLREEGSNLLQETRYFIDLVAKTGNTLVVTSKSVRQLITEEPRNLDPVGDYLGAKIVHYSNLRGLDEFKNYQNVVIVGREQPPPLALEMTAKALWWDSNASIHSVSETGGNYSYDYEEKRGYRLRSKLYRDTKVQTHPDRRVQDLLEIQREAEITQGIDSVPRQPQLDSLA